VGRNPKTGSRVEVPSKRIPYFKPSKELRDLVNQSAAGGSAATRNGGERPAAPSTEAEPQPTSPSSDVEF
jgi:Bacterial DNA-binding protein